MTFEVMPKQLYEKLCNASKAKQNSQKMSKDTLWEGLRKAGDKIYYQIVSKDTPLDYVRCLRTPHKCEECNEDAQSLSAN